jgi:hypothetical protein
LPTPVQAVGAYAIRVRIRGTNFEVQLVGSPNRVTPRCIGRISPTASGSQILVRMGSSRGTRVSYALAVVWLSFLSYQAGSLFAMMLVLGAATLGAGTLSHWTFAEAEREALFMLVAEIAATPVTGQRANLNASLPNDRCG